MRTVARRARAPEALKRMVHKWRALEADVSSTSRALRDLERTHKEVFRIRERMRSKVWRLRVRARRQMMLVGVYETAEFPCPILASVP
jgi:hypothetical protein